MSSSFTPLEQELGRRREGAGRKGECVVSRLFMDGPGNAKRRELAHYPAVLCSRLGLPGRTGMRSVNLY